MENCTHPKLIINNESIDYIKGSLCWSEGVNKISKINFDLDTTVENIELASALKSDQNGHVITIVFSEKNITTAHAILTNDYVIKFGKDGIIPLIFEGTISKT